MPFVLCFRRFARSLPCHGSLPCGLVAEWVWPQTFSFWTLNLVQLQLLELVVAPNVPARGWRPLGVAEGGEGARFVEDLV